MRMEYLLAALAVLAVANAQTATSGQEVSCGKQMELEKQCTLTIETSPEAAMLKEHKKQAIKDCLQNYPVDCHADKEAAHACFISIAQTSDSDPDFVAAKAKSLPAVDECFQEYPPNVGEGFAEIFMPMKPPHHHRGPPHHKGHNASSSSEEGPHHKQGNASGSASKEGGGGGGSKSGSSEHMHHPKCGHKKNNTSGSGSGSKEGSGKSAGKSGEKDPKCEKTKEQKQCIKEKLEALSKDADFIGVMDTLIRQKHKCKNLVNWSCTPKSRKQRKCVFKATEPCREAFMGKMATCMQSKGFTLPPFMKHGPHGTSPPPTGH